ncbi:laminin subunit alpha [Biomphalaria pfeifferi]|uniref:Laminin subunit alpha n=1 Tax=Biomphalaria pfeifferi TaxID=112525 RepID=A0AAD8BJE3_BIOPF|nr:laminin subunit alpha [Biomphalaria pfeifferi]
MEFVIALLVSLFTVSTTRGQDSDGGESHCFSFPGDTFLQFDFNNFNNSNDIYFSLKFKTRESNSVILYSRGSGTHYDDEAVFIRNGKVGYHLFNTSPTGVEGYFGAFFIGNELVNTNEWVTLHVYRMYRDVNSRQRRVHPKTGFAVEIQGVRHEYVDHLVRTDISLSNSIFIGGYSQPLSSTIKRFVGQIRDIREHSNGLAFETPTLNFMASVQTFCSEDSEVEPN